MNLKAFQAGYLQKSSAPGARLNLNRFQAKPVTAKKFDGTGKIQVPQSIATGALKTTTALGGAAPKVGTLSKTTAPTSPNAAVRAASSKTLSSSPTGVSNASKSIANKLGVGSLFKRDFGLKGLTG